MGGSGGAATRSGPTGRAGCGRFRSSPPVLEDLPGSPSVTRPAAGVCQVGVLADGTPVSVRALVAADRGWFTEWTAALSDQSKYRRFFSCYTELPPALLDRLVDDVDGVRHTALVATVPALRGCAVAVPSWPERWTVPVAVGRFVRLRADDHMAEVALTVGDAWQGRGVGTVLVRALVIAAQEMAVTTFTATVLAENLPSLRLLHRAGRLTRWAADGPDIEIDIEIDIELTAPPLPTPSPKGPAQPGPAPLGGPRRPWAGPPALPDRDVTAGVRSRIPEPASVRSPTRRRG